MRIYTEEQVKVLLDGINNSIARSDDYGDSWCSAPIREALSAFRKEQGREVRSWWLREETFYWESGEKKDFLRAHTKKPNNKDVIHVIELPGEEGAS